jgi:hypothetical protein
MVTMASENKRRIGFAVMSTVRMRCSGTLRTRLTSSPEVICNSVTVIR